VAKRLTIKDGGQVSPRQGSSNLPCTRPARGDGRSSSSHPWIGAGGAWFDKDGKCTINKRGPGNQGPWTVLRAGPRSPRSTAAGGFPAGPPSPPIRCPRLDWFKERFASYCFFCHPLPPVAHRGAEIRRMAKEGLCPGPVQYPGFQGPARATRRPYGFNLVINAPRVEGQAGDPARPLQVHDERSARLLEG